MFLAKFRLLVCQVHPNSYKVIHSATNLYVAHDIVLQLNTFLKIYHPHLNNQTTEAYSLFTGRRKLKSLTYEIPESKKYWNTKLAILKGNVWGATEGEMPMMRLCPAITVVNLLTLEDMIRPERAMFAKLMALS